MAGSSDFRPGLEETRFVWTGQSRRDWRLGLKVAAMCAACLGTGYYVGRASVYPGLPTLATAEKVASETSQKKSEPVQSTSVAIEGSEKSAQSAPEKSAAEVARSSQAASVPASDKVAAQGSGGSEAGAASKTAASVRIINADAEKGRQETSAEAQEKPRTHVTAPKKKKTVAERQGEREKPAAERSTGERDDAYVQPRPGYQRSDAYVPPRTGYGRDDAYVPPRASYGRDDDYPAPRAGYGPDRYNEPWRSRRYGQIYDGYDPSDDVPRDWRGYLRDFRDRRGY